MEKLTYPGNGMSAQQYDFRDLAQMQVDTINASTGQLTGYDCPKCKNRGFIMRIGEEGNKVCRDCECMSIRRNLKHMKISGMESLIQRQTFDNFRTEAPWQRKLLLSCKAYLFEKDRWLVLCGQSGSGKTHLCSAVCGELMRNGVQVQYMLWRDAVARLKDMNRDFVKREEEKERYKNAQVLYIDDLLKVGGNAPPTPWELSLAFELINYRYVAGLRTVLSTELGPKQLMQLDQAVGGRILEKAGDYLLHVAPDTGRNMRMRRQ